MLNVATTNNRIRVPGRKLLAAHATAAAAIGASGLVVHGGQQPLIERVAQRHPELKLVLDFQGAVSPLLAAFAANPTVAADSETGPAASIGAKQSCYQWSGAIAVLAKVTATAKTGSGPIALQVYKKRK